MEVNKGVLTEKHQEIEEHESHKGALFATLVFVGGTIVLFIILLLALFIARM